MKIPTTITKLEILHAPKGHQEHLSGTGAHKNKKKQQKGDRRDQFRRAVAEYA